MKGINFILYQPTFRTEPKGEGLTRKKIAAISRIICLAGLPAKVSVSDTLPPGPLALGFFYIKTDHHHRSGRRIRTAWAAVTETKQAQDRGTRSSTATFPCPGVAEGHPAPTESVKGSDGSQIGSKMDPKKVFCGRRKKRP